MDASDCTSPDFWSSRYVAETTPWDLRGVPVELEGFLQRTKSPGRVLIPGCGFGYEVRAFHDAGFEVTALDFSPVVVERARKRLGPLADKILLGDFFRHDFGGERFDLVYERTFLCALPERRWPEYAARMAELIRPGGRLAGMFLYGVESRPPPFPLANEQLNEILGDKFQPTRDEAVAISLPVFEGMEERWQEWTRSASA